MKKESIINKIGFDDEKRKMYVQFEKHKCPICGEMIRPDLIAYQLDQENYDRVKHDFIKKTNYD